MLTRIFRTNKYLITGISLGLSLAALFSLISANVLAAGSTSGTPNAVSNNPQESRQGLVITPNMIIVDEKDRGKTFTIKITNKTAEDYTLDVSETRLVRDSHNKILPVTAKVTDNILEISTGQLTVPKNSEKTITVKLKSVSLAADNYPGVLFSRSSLQQTSKPGAVINGAIIVTILTQNYQAELNAANSIKVDYSILSSNSNFKVLGEVSNSGGKFFDPSGSVSVYKDGMKIYEKQITSQVSGLLFPREKKDYQVDWINRLNPFAKIGNYTFESSINIPSSPKNFVSRISFFYIPVDALILFIAAALAFLLIFLRIGKKVRAGRLPAAGKRKNHLPGKSHLTS